MKKTVYLDTSIISFLYDERPEFEFLSSTTKEFWTRHLIDYEVYTSIETLIELEKGNFPNQQKMINEADKILLLDKNEKIYEIARYYLNHKAMPQQLSGDAIHLAIATYYKLDLLITWNYKHLANVNKMNHIRILNTRLGFYTPDIVTPLQLLGAKEEENGL